jgi:cyclophilin family peptidyl-prolyl cis-trans isomerase
MQCALDISINRGPSERVVIGLYGKEAPQFTKLFTRLCAGALTEGLSYTGSSVFRIDKGKRIDMGRLGAGTGVKQIKMIDRTGRVRVTNTPYAEAFIVNDSNELSHDRPGIVSMKR